MDKENQKIAARLKEVGLSRYDNLTEFAKALGMSYENLAQYLSGKSKPGWKLQNRLRDLGADIEWLMTGKTLDELKKSGEVSIWQAQVGHMTEEEKKDFDKMVSELLQEMREDPDTAQEAMDLMRTHIAGKKALKKKKKKKK